MKMLDLKQIVKVRWNGLTRKWYEEKGYTWTKQNDYFDCKIEDVQKTSTAKVLVKCDYCGETFPKQYRNYFKEREIVEKDCCKNRKCMVDKSKEVNLKTIGVENPMQLKEIREKTSEKQRTPFNEIIKLCEEKGLILLSEEKDYENDRSRLFVICSNHESEGIQETNFANIKKNKNCCFYGGHDSIGFQKRLNGEDVYNDFIKIGLIPLFKPDDYIDNQIPMPYICPKHKNKGVQYRAYMNLFTNDGCYYCSKERMKEKLKLDEKFVFNHLKSKGLIPIEGEVYKNKDELIKYRCEKHPNIIQTTNYGNFRSTIQCCDYCRAEMSLSNLNKQLRSSINKWRRYSISICNNRCVLTGLNDFQVHHLYTYNNIILDALKKLNIEIKINYDGYEIEKIKKEVKKMHKNNLGVCVHPKLHIIFHQIYSKSNNTKEQFSEFKLNYYNGMYDNELDDELKSYNSLERLKQYNI